MSLYEIISTASELSKRREPKVEFMDDDQFEASLQRWRDMGLKDVRV